jgi:capsid portal protein
MTRKFSEQSYNYIQGWLKNKYANDPDFKRKINETNKFCQFRKKIQNKLNMILLDVIVDHYHSRGII